MAQIGTFEALQSLHNDSLSRRARPSELCLDAQFEEPVPLRQSKLGRRESRLGLRNLFTRSSRAAKDHDGPLSPKSPAHRPLGIRASIADLSNWPYGQQTPRPDTAKSRPLETTYENDEHAWSPPPTPLGHGNEARPQKQPRETLATWTPPPLFKAFPQAIRYGKLAAPTMAADAILRINEKNNAASSPERILPEELAEELQNVAKGKPRRRTRGDSASAANLQWTTKIYVIVTSGYLLQYAGDGHFDRLPEKVLRLGSSSAAFASDAIPGRHWVLQISSTTTSDGTAAQDSRSLFSRLPFRMSERRNASNLLMVFEGAQDMEDWIACLRGEIEKLGGKRSLSETGVPKPETTTRRLLERPSQRTLIIRDPSRYSRSMTNTPLPSRDGTEHQAMESSTRVVEGDGTPRDHSLDDASTNSTVSQDGRQLDSLCESSNRLSVVSSGQRTILTSTCSSPAHSPKIEAFSPEGQASRRISVQTATPLIAESASALKAVTEQHSPLLGCESSRASPTDTILPSPLTSHPTPNFSVPNSSTRRFSYAKSPVAEFDLPSSPTRAGESGGCRGLYRKPMNAIRVGGRRLSTVEDQPTTPKERTPTRPVTSHNSKALPARPVPIDAIGIPRRPLMPIGHDAIPTRVSSLAPRPRRLSSLSALKKHQDQAAALHELGAKGKLPATDEHGLVPSTEKVRRRRSSIDPTEASRSRSVGTTRAAKRASIGSAVSEVSNSYELHCPVVVEPPSRRAPPPTTALPPIPSTPSPTSRPSSRREMAFKALCKKRSLPQLVMADGPPPVPPPTCALPPIPQKQAVQV